MAKETRLEEEAERLEARRELSRIQRRRIAGWLKAQRNELIQEREAFQRESKHAQQQLRRERARWDKEREEFDELRRTFEANAENGNGVDIGELSQLQADRAALNSRVQHLEHQLAEAETQIESLSQGPDTTEIDDLQRRFEMAIEDVRELKRRNAELEEALAEIQAVGGQGGAVPNGQNWAATKNSLMSLLTKDGHSEAAFDADDRLTVEGTIRITDEIVGQRDQEITELRKLLSQKTVSPAEASNSVTANEELLAQDEIIRLERERLAALNQEWREKLRQAEVDLSVQRAGLARERAELQEKIRVIEAEREQLASQQNGNQPAPGSKPKKPARRWMERMGLKEQDQE